MTDLLHGQSVSRILVCGSRDWDDLDAITETLAMYVDDDPIIIHGAARGADEMAAFVADAMGFEVRAFPANWQLHGKRAGILRNIEMLDVGKPDKVIAFRRNGSRGTTHTIEAAKKRGIPVEVIEP